MARYAMPVVATVLLAGLVPFVFADYQSPLAQLKDGTPLSEIECRDGKVLLERNQRPYCVGAETAEELEQRGWGMVEQKYAAPVKYSHKCNHNHVGAQHPKYDESELDYMLMSVETGYDRAMNTVVSVGPDWAESGIVDTLENCYVHHGNGFNSARLGYFTYLTIDEILSLGNYDEVIHVKVFFNHDEPEWTENFELVHGSQTMVESIPQDAPPDKTWMYHITGQCDDYEYEHNIFVRNEHSEDGYESYVHNEYNKAEVDAFLYGKDYSTYYEYDEDLLRSGYYIHRLSEYFQAEHDVTLHGKHNSGLRFGYCSACECYGYALFFLVDDKSVGTMIDLGYEIYG